MDKHKIPVLEGYNIRLRGITETDTEDVLRWRSDPGLGRFLGNETPTQESHLRFLHAYFLHDDDYYFIAETIKDTQSIGTVAIYSVHQHASHAEFGRLVADASFSWLAAEISFVAIRFAFDTLKLRKLYAGVQAMNRKAYRFDRMLGFYEEGRQVQQYWNGSFADDLIHLAMFRPQYESLLRKFELTD